MWNWRDFWRNVEKKGKTIFLLKANSKPVPQERKRRKISALGTYEQFKQL